MVLGKLPVPGRPTIWMIVGQRPIAFVVGVGFFFFFFFFFDIFTLHYPFSYLLPISGGRSKGRLAKNKQRNKQIWRRRFLNGFYHIWTWWPY